MRNTHIIVVLPVVTAVPSLWIVTLLSRKAAVVVQARVLRRNNAIVDFMVTFDVVARVRESEVLVKFVRNDSQVGPSDQIYGKCDGALGLTVQRRLGDMERLSFPSSKSCEIRWLGVGIDLTDRRGLRNVCLQFFRTPTSRNFCWHWSAGRISDWPTTLSLVCIHASWEVHRSFADDK